MSSSRDLVKKDILVESSKPPECRLRCLFCGYTEVKSKYKHVSCPGRIYAALFLYIVGLLILIFTSS